MSRTCHNTVFQLAGWPLLFLALVSVGAGCHRVGQGDIDLVYASSEKVLALPDSHQLQIRETLETYYGTPDSPTHKAPDFEAESDDDLVPLIDTVDHDQLRLGAVAYRRRCAGCHGTSGDGNGPAEEFLNPKPRDYRRGVFKFTSTMYGSKPLRSDLVRTIRRGAKGTSMPAFPWLPDAEVDAIVDYVILLSYRGQMEEMLAREALDYDEDENLEAEAARDFSENIDRSWQRAREKLVLPTAPPARTVTTVEAGRNAFLSRGCSKCHGADGRGQTQWLSQQFLAHQASLPEAERIEINYDAWGNVAPAANLTAGMLHGGRRPVDIYRRIYAGINGTPMPTFGEALSEEPETIWHLVHYVQSVVESTDEQESRVDDD